MDTLSTVLFIAGACYLCHVFTAAQHHNAGHTETDTIHFYYDPTMHYFVAATTTQCFMVSLSHDEQDHVHTTQGIEDIELKMMRSWMGVLPETKVYHDDIHLPENIRRWCLHKDIYLLERNSTEISSTMSILG